MPEKRKRMQLFGVIGSYLDGITVEQVADQLNEIGDGPLTVDISSPGGDAHAGLGIHSLLSDRGDVEFKVHGLAASAASFITTAGPTEISNGGIYMLHSAWTVLGGNAKDFRSSADRLEVHDDAIATLYANRTDAPKEEIQTMMENETWLTAEDAMELGFVDSITGESADIAASIRIPKAFSYEHVPHAIAACVTEDEGDFYRQFRKPAKQTDYRAMYAKLDKLRPAG